MMLKVLVYLLGHIVLAVAAIWPPLQQTPISNIRKHIIKVRARGFLPFESDILLPLGILKHMQSQQRQRIGRIIPNWKGSTYQQWRPPFSQQQKYLTPTTSKPTYAKHKNYVRLEPSSKKNFKKYNLYDDDGELLLDLQFHGNDLEATTNRRYYSTPRPVPLHEYHADAIQQQFELQPEASTLNMVTSSASPLASSVLALASASASASASTSASASATSIRKTNQNILRINLP